MLTIIKSLKRVYVYFLKIISKPILITDYCVIGLEKYLIVIVLIKWYVLLSKTLINNHKLQLHFNIKSYNKYEILYLF